MVRLTMACAALAVAPLLVLGCGGGGGGGGGGKVKDDTDMCESDADCEGARTCCSGVCADTSTSLSHCQSCGNACANDQLCAPTGCAPLTFSSICDSDVTVVVHDGVSSDDAAGDGVAAAVVTACAPSAALNPSTISRWNDGYIDQVTGRPTGGPGTAYVVGGGSVFQPLAKYLQVDGYAPVVTASDGITFSLLDRATGTTFANEPLAALSASRDYIVGQMAYDEVSGSIVLNVFGIFDVGTTMAGWYFANVVAQNPTLFAGGRWLVGRWEDGDADGQPSLSEFTVLGQD